MFSTDSNASASAVKDVPCSLAAFDIPAFAIRRFNAFSCCTFRVSVVKWS